MNHKEGIHTDKTSFTSWRTSIMVAFSGTCRVNTLSWFLKDVAQSWIRTQMSFSPLSPFYSAIVSENEPLLFWVCSSRLRINWLVSINLSTQFTKQTSVLESSLGPGLSIHVSQQTSVIWCTSCWKRCFWDSISMNCWSRGSAVAPCPSILM